MKRRHVPKYSSLTSLLDVLFILMFASLAQAAALVKRAQEQPPTDKRSPADSAHSKAGTQDAGAGTAPDAGVSDGGVAAPSVAVDAGAMAGTPKQKFYDQAIAVLMKSVQQRRAVYVNVSKQGVLKSLEYLDGIYPKHVELGTPLTRRVADKDFEWVYNGDSDKRAQICTIVREQLATDTLEHELIIITPAVPLDELTNVLKEGMRRDQRRCGHNAIAVVVAPSDDTNTPAKPKQP